MLEHLIDAIIVAAMTGGTSAVATVIALRVHVQYLRERIDKIGQHVTRLDERVEETRDRVLTNSR